MQPMLFVGIALVQQIPNRGEWPLWQRRVFCCACSFVGIVQFICHVQICGKKLCQQILYAWKKRFATNNSIVVTLVLWLSPRPTKLKRQTTATMWNFRCDCLFQHKLIRWREIVIATAEILVARNKCDNLNYSWRHSIASNFSLVARSTSRNVQIVSSEKLVRQLKVFVAILYFNTILFGGAK